eukprot:tig00020603_g11834.t1
MHGPAKAAGCGLLFEAAGYVAIGVCMFLLVWGATHATRPRCCPEGAIASNAWLKTFRRPANVTGAITRQFSALSNWTALSAPLRRARCGRPREPPCSRPNPVKPGTFCPGADLQQLPDVKDLRQCVEACVRNNLCALAALRKKGGCHLKRLGVHCMDAPWDEAWYKPGVQEFQATLPKRDPFKARVGGKMAVVVPLRDRKLQEVPFVQMVPELLRAQYPSPDSFTVFFVEQEEGYRFNRGALIDAGAALVLASDFDWICVHDVDTLPKTKKWLYDQYDDRVTHVTPNWAHPVYSVFPIYFGGNVIFPANVLREIDGFPVDLWGWGQEDDAARWRLVQRGLWPAEEPYLESLDGFDTKRLHKELFTHSNDGHGARLKRPFWARPPYPYGGFQELSYWTLAAAAEHNGTVLRFTTHVFCDPRRVPWCLQPPPPPTPAPTPTPTTTPTPPAAAAAKTAAATSPHSPSAPASAALRAPAPTPPPATPATQAPTTPTPTPAPASASASGSAVARPKAQR